MLNHADLYRKIGELYSKIPMTFFNGYAFPPLRIAFILTHRCNLKCEMCFVWKHSNPAEEKKKELSTQEIINLIDQTPFYSVLTFTGGEPLVRNDIRQILEYSIAKRRVHLVTNGTLADDSLTEFLIDNAADNFWNKGLLSLGVSLEGPAEIHDRAVQVQGARDKTVAFIKKASELKRKRGKKFPIIDLKVVMSRFNFDYLTDLFRTAEESGADLISYQIENSQSSSYGVPLGGPNAHAHLPPKIEEVSPEKVKSALIELKSAAVDSKVSIRFNPEMPIERMADRYQNRFRSEYFYCDTAWTVLHIGPFGHVYPCFTYSMGDVRKSSLNTIWNGEKYRKFRRMLKKERIFPGCAGCCVMKCNNQGRDS